MAYGVVHELKDRLKPGWMPVFSSDGLKHYYFAITAHFCQWSTLDGEKKPKWVLLASLLYDQVVKHQQRRKLVEVEQRMLCGQKSDYFSRLKAAGFSGIINTSFVERVNLTIRHAVSKLTRRTWGLAQFTPELLEHLFWWLAYYHFVRPHQSLREILPQPLCQKRTINPTEVPPPYTGNGGRAHQP
jgi:transposase InsO family protein